MSTPPASATRPYFAYSATLDPAELERWFPERGGAGLKLPPGRVAEAPNTDLVYNVPSSRWGGRVAAITRRPGQSVFGLVFDVPTASWPALLEAEGATGGELQEWELDLKVEGRLQKATAFTIRAELATTTGPVSQTFANALARSAERAGLPAEYVTRLKAEALILDRVQGFGQKHHLR